MLEDNRRFVGPINVAPIEYRMIAIVKSKQKGTVGFFHIGESNETCPGGVK